MPSIAGSAESQGFLETSRKQPAQHTIDASCSAVASVINRTDASTYPARCSPAVPDAWVQEAAGRLIQQHGADAMAEVTRLFSLAHRRGDSDAFVLIFRVGL